MLGLQLGGFQLALLSAVKELGIEPAMMGLPITAQYIAISVMPLIFGPISDRIGKKNIIVYFMILFIAGCFVTWQSGSTMHLLVGAFIIGAGASVCECSVTASVSDVFTGEQEKYLNFVHGFFCVGAVVSPLLLQALMDNLSASWRLIFLICAIAMAAILPAILSVRTTPAGNINQPQQKNKIENPLLVFGFAICVFLYVSIEASLTFFADTVFTIELNYPALGALAISLFWGAMGAGRLFFGRLKKMPRNLPVISFFLLASAIIIIAFIRHEILILVLFTIAGFVSSSIWPGIVNAASALNRNASGAIMSYLNLGGGLGSAVIPLAVGAIMDAANMTVSFSVLTILSVIAGIYLLKNSNVPDSK